MKKRLIKSKALFQIFLVLTLVFFTTNIVAKDVSAAEGCCKDLGNEQYCQTINNPDECISDYTQTSCDYVGGCEQGCCNLVEEGGGCSKGVSKIACEKQDGVWSEGRLCEYDAECFLGCCVIGSQGYLTIEDDCDGEFRKDVINENECVDIGRETEEGCCVKGKDCVYGRENECVGDFNKKRYCSSISECGLDSHSYTDCGSGLDVEDVFWYDDKGNPEGVVKVGDLDKDGKSVGFSGDCNYFRGNICRDTNNDGRGDECATLDCEDTWDNPNVDGDGGLRKNGESWCEYQSAVGPGRDLPGSSHYRHVCFNGKETVEVCGSDRGEEGICVYHDLQFSNDEVYSVAACVDNTWEECINCGGNAYCCEDPSKSCVWGGGKCLPLVPPENSDYCSFASMNVKTFWQKKCGGSWGCKSGCEAYEDGFLIQTNSLCNLYGNCGAKYNLAGEFSNLGHGRACEGKACRDRVNENDYVFENVLQAGLGLKTATQEVDDRICATCGPKGAAAQAALFVGIASAAFLTVTIGVFAAIAAAQAAAVAVALAGAMMGGGAAAGGAAAAAASLGAASGKVAAAAIADPEPVTKTVLIVIAIVLIIAAGVSYVLFTICGGTDKKTISVGCSEYRPPLGGDDCWKCNTGMDKDEKNNDCRYGDCGLLPYSDSFSMGEYSAYECTKQLCKSLGSSCGFEQSKDGPICISQDISDIKAPKIMSDMDEDDYYCNKERPGITGRCDLVDYGGDGFEIEDDLIDFYEGSIKKKWPPVVLKIETDEYSLCKYSKNPTETFDEMFDFFDMDGGVFSLRHNMSFKGLVNGTHNFYIRCEDYLQNRNEKSFAIEFNIAPQPDLTPVVIEDIIPEEGSYVKYGQKNVSVTLDINEPIKSSTKGSELSRDGSGCKWGTEPNVDYDDMKNLMSCYSSIIDGNKCDGVLTDIKSGKNTFYFRCKDMDGNENKQDWPQEVGLGSGYNLFGSQSNLTISSIGCIYNLPDGGLVDNCDDIFAKNFTFKLITSGGAKSGNADCDFNGNDFYRTGGNIHEQCIGCGAGFGLIPGTYAYTFSCEDVADNIVAVEKDIVLNVDLNPPEVIAIYQDASHLLNIETNEEAYCRYSFKRTFNFDEATVMSGDLLRHKIGVENDFYRIGCKDRFDNYNAPFNVYLL